MALEFHLKLFLLLEGGRALGALVAPGAGTLLARTGAAGRVAGAAVFARQMVVVYVLLLMLLLLLLLLLLMLLLFVAPQRQIQTGEGHGVATLGRRRRRRRRYRRRDVGDKVVRGGRRRSDGVAVQFLVFGQIVLRFDGVVAVAALVLAAAAVQRHVVPGTTRHSTKR